MVILTPITINNHFNNANYVTKVDHLCSERHTFNFLLKKVDFRENIRQAIETQNKIWYNKKEEHTVLQYCVLKVKHTDLHPVCIPKYKDSITYSFRNCKRFLQANHRKELFL